MRDMPEVEAVAGAAITPYSGNTWNSDIEVGGRRYRYGASAGTDDFATAMGLDAHARPLVHARKTTAPRGGRS